MYVALPAFAAARRAVAPCGRAAIDRHLTPAGPTAANPSHAAAAGKWDRKTRTDIVPFHRPSKLQKLPTDYSEAVINTVEATNHSKEIFTMLLALFFFLK